LTEENHDIYNRLRSVATKTLEIVVNFELYSGLKFFIENDILID